MDGTVGGFDAEIVSGVAVLAEQQRPHPGATRPDVVHGQGRHQPLQRFQEQPLGEGASVLVDAEGHVVEEQLPGASVAQGFHGVFQIEIRLPVALPLEGEHGIGAALDLAVGHAGEVHAQEGEVGIGHWVNEVLDLVLGVVFQLVVIAAESDDPLFQLHAVFPCQAVRLQARAHDHLVGGVRPSLACDGGAHDRARPFGAEVHHFLAQPHLAFGLDLQGGGGHFLGGVAEVHNAGAAHKEGGHPLAVGLDLGELVRVDALEALDAVLLADAVDLLQHGQLGIVRGHNHLAAHVVGHVVLLAELHELPAALHAVRGFQRAWLVIQA